MTRARIRVLYDYQVFGWQRYGGISRYFVELANRVGATPGVSATVYRGFNISEYNFQPTAVNQVGCKRIIIPKTGRLVEMINRVGFLAFGRLHAVDVYHPTYYAVARPSRLMPMVVTVHDMIHELFPTVLRGRDAKRTVREKRRSILEADALLAVSESTKRDLVRILGVEPGKVTVTHLANALLLEPTGSQGKSRPYFLYVGPRKNYKNFDLLLEAYGTCAELVVGADLVCFGGGALTTEELQRIVKLGLSGRVRQCGGPDQVLVNLYSGAVALVYPSLYEGFGIPPLEAMHYGCPVIASNTSSMPEVIGDAGILVDPRDPNAFSVAMNDLMHDDIERQSLSARGTARAAQFSWDACAEKTLEVYKQVSR